MVVKIKESEFEKYVKRSFEYDKRGLLNVSSFIFNKVVENERDNVMLMLIGRFKVLRYEDLEEVYNDGCLVLWEKMKDENFILKENCIVGYLMGICKNIGMHYLRKVDDEIVSLDRIMERRVENVSCGEKNGIEDMFDVLYEGGNDDEVFERLEKVWSKLSDVDRIILESYYFDNCKMDEIARRVGYKNGNSVKSRKNKILGKMMIMMKKREEDFKKPLLVA